MTDRRINLFGVGPATLRERLAPLSPRPFHADQIFHWIHGRGVTDFAAMTNLPRTLRSELGQRFRIGPPAIASAVRAADGTTKYTIRLEDGERIESVLIPEGSRLTLCISSQVGCALGCRFCLTAEMGFRRNLTAAEIGGQVWLLGRAADRIDRKFNIVMMGMGEPLQNLEAVMEALAILADPNGSGIPHRRVTVSTAGYLPGIRRLAEFPVRPRLAVSLAATTDAQRNRLMPINRRWPIGTLLRALRQYPLKPRERITFEYVLLSGVNDTLEDAARLSRLLRGLRAKVNLIRYNRTERERFHPPPENRVRQFRDRLLEQGTPVSIRKRKGEEIFAACGQLALRDAAAEPAAATAATVPGGGRRR